MFSFAEKIMAVIGSRYPGGLEAFVEEGGAIHMGSYDPLEIFIYIPNDDLSLEELTKGCVEGVKFTQAHYKNFVDQDREDILNILKGALVACQKSSCDPHSVSMGFGTLVVEISCQDKKTAETLMAYFQEIPSIACGRFVYPDGLLCLDRPYIKLEVSKRDTSISKEDIMDVQILVQSCNTVEDFLNSI